MSNKILKISLWIFFFAVVFVVGFVATFYYFDDAERKTKRFCEKFELGTSIEAVMDVAQEYGDNFSVSEDHTSAGLYLTSGLFTFAGCNLNFENKKLVEKYHWLD